MSHHFAVRVYYEDTDAGGIVYHANYLKFIERARTEWVRELGIHQSELRATQGLMFVVRRVAADYLAPARLDDSLDVVTDLTSLGGARLDLAQQVRRGRDLLFTAAVTLVCVGPDGRPARLTPALRVLFAG